MCWQFMYLCHNVYLICGYKPTNFDIVDYDCDYDDDTISDCMEIVDKFKKMYSKVSI